MKKLFVLLGISSVLLVGCGEESMVTNNDKSSEVTNEVKNSSQELENNELTNNLSLRQKRDITEVAEELDDAVSDYKTRYVEELHAIVMLIDNDVVLNEYLRAIDGQEAYVDAFQSTGNTLQDTSKKIVRDSGIDDLALIFAAPLEDSNASIIFKFENGTRLIDVFEELKYY